MHYPPEHLSQLVAALNIHEGLRWDSGLPGTFYGKESAEWTVAEIDDVHNFIRSELKDRGEELKRGLAGNY